MASGGSAEGGFQGPSEGLPSDAGTAGSGEGIAESDFGNIFGEAVAEQGGLAESEIAAGDIAAGAVKQAEIEAASRSETEASWWRAAGEADAGASEQGAYRSEVPDRGESADDLLGSEQSDRATAELFEGSEQVDRDAAELLDKEGGERLDREAEELFGNRNLDAEAAELIGGWERPPTAGLEKPQDGTFESAPVQEVAPETAPPPEASTFEQRQAELEAEAEQGWRETAVERTEFYREAERELAEYRKNPELYAERLEMSEAEYAEAMRDRTWAERIRETGKRSWEALSHPETRQAAAERLIREYDQAVDDFFGRKRR